jgi:hypothetical protein
MFDPDDYGYGDEEDFIPPPPEMIKLKGEIIAETPKAILFRVEETQGWLPKSQLGKVKNNPKESFATIEVPDWLVREKGYSL